MGLRCSEPLGPKWIDQKLQAKTHLPADIVSNVTDYSSSLDAIRVDLANHLERSANIMQVRVFYKDKIVQQHSAKQASAYEEAPRSTGIDSTGLQLHATLLYRTQRCQSIRSGHEVSVSRTFNSTT
jgi:hypothetical protein